MPVESEEALEDLSKDGDVGVNALGGLGRRWETGGNGVRYEVLTLHVPREIKAPLTSPL